MEVNFPDKCSDCGNRYIDPEADEGTLHRYNGTEPYNGECSCFYGDYFFGKFNCPGYWKDDEE